MRSIYNLFFLVFAAFYVPYMAVKGKFHTGFSQRFACFPEGILRIKNPVWIHAVSVGEALVAARLCEEIKKAMPDVRVVVSTTTKTGHEMIKKASKSVDGVFYYPIDLSWIVRKAMDKIAPSAYVIIETELWPNMLEESFSRSIPVILANGRISDRSFEGYRRIAGVSARMLRCFSVVCVQTPRDAEKMEALGCGHSKLRVTGNIKFDVSFSTEREKEVEIVNEVFPGGKRVIVAGSTHFPEETLLIDEFVKLSFSGLRVKLVIAPRHVERKDAIRIYVEKAGLKCCFFSDIAGGQAPDAQSADVMVVDTIGHLKDLYSMASVVFIGGSLAKRGGQNPIEAAKWGKAFIFGPNMTNFREVARDFVESGAAITVESADRMGEVIGEILRDDEKRREMEESSRAVIEKNSGALKKTVEAIAVCLGRGRS
jgi:3-deoxy-D-manno-octulosonic-acid transferase